ncbi:hypothetical protein BJ508DRAFT_81150 [Ascobolus immersus RN42]|uniref:Uncharacterized protein n=1 Tax=Ascobolus immersus RN42 TaxID=1160509 RepID=A0A3N4I9Z0_ASCIM|nr:hypothetical protein BJ508DRAFT_81150 [Ascobolus immersus RN42]
MPFSPRRSFKSSVFCLHHLSTAITATSSPKIHPTLPAQTTDTQPSTTSCSKTEYLRSFRNIRCAILASNPPAYWCSGIRHFSSCENDERKSESVQVTVIENKQSDTHEEVHVDTEIRNRLDANGTINASLPNGTSSLFYSVSLCFCPGSVS